MPIRYESFNEILFESYCKTVITQYINHARREKKKLAKRHLPMSILTDEWLYKLADDNPTENEAIQDTRVFTVRDMDIAVHDPILGQALAYLLPKNRDVILLSFFLAMSDREIAHMLSIGKSTVQRRRMIALQRLKQYLEEI